MSLTKHLLTKAYSYAKKSPKRIKFFKSIWKKLSKTIGYINSLKTTMVKTSVFSLCEYSLEEWVEKNNSTEPGGERKIILKKNIINVRPQKITLPYTSRGRIMKLEHLANQSPLIVDSSVLFLPEGRVLGLGDIVTPDNLLLKEFTSETNRQLQILKEQEKGKHVPKIKGRVAVLTGDSTGYYHWMMDLIPRFGLLQAAGVRVEDVDKFLVNDYVSKFQIETLEHLGIPPKKIITSQWNPDFVADVLIVPSILRMTNMNWRVNYIRNTFLALAKPANNLPKRIYISRGQVTHRRLLNENEVFALLEGFDFTKIIMEDYTFSEQISIMAAADVIVAPHGAGLTNIAFCKPKVKVIEIASPKAINALFWLMSCQLESIQYFYVFAEGEILDTTDRDKTKIYNNDDMTVNIEELKLALKAADII